MDVMDNGGSTIIRSYDCVFCQRGFTTAQALGGHMNIHRKDRANNPTTNKPINITSPTKEPINNTILSTKEMLLEDDDDYQIDVANTTRLFYSSNSFLSSQNNNNHDHNNNSSFEGKVHRFLGSEKWGDHGTSSLRGGSPAHMLGNNRVQDHDHSQGAEELDLELRLGHYSW